VVAFAPPDDDVVDSDLADDMVEQVRRAAQECPSGCIQYSTLGTSGSDALSTPRPRP
jgi:ferredoxin